MPVTFVNALKTETAASAPSTAIKAVESDMSLAGRSGRNDPFPDLEIIRIDVDKIDDAPRRVRRPVEKQIEAVKRSIERFGNRVPILIKRNAGTRRYEVVDGHTRLAAARLLGAERMPCIAVDDLADPEVRRLKLSLNKLPELAEWDKDALCLEVTELIEISGDFEIPGYELPEIEAIRFGSDNDVDPADEFDDAPESEPVPVSRPGDLWVLGEHKLCCRSARDRDSIQEMLDGARMDAIFTDHPYNVKINGNARSADAGFGEFAEASGEMNRDDYVAFLVDTLGNAANVLRPGGVIFACIDWRHVGDMTKAFETVGLDLLNICVWVKSNPGLGSLYRSQHEFVLVGRNLGASHTNNVQLGSFGRNRSNVWHYAGATGGKTDPDDDHSLHPTVKPIRMVMDALLDVTAPGDLILDPFLGSGTTLLAAERTRRRCFGVEIEPRYVDVAIRRWQEMTGASAVLADAGQTFEDVAQARSGAEVQDGPDRRGRITNSVSTSEEDF